MVMLYLFLVVNLISVKHKPQVNSNIITVQMVPYRMLFILSKKSLPMDLLVNVSNTF